MGLNARSFPFLLAAAALVVAGFVLAPYRAVTFHRSDGETVRLPAPDRLSHLADAWDYLQIGRNVWEGRGYTSLFTYVPFLPESPPMEAAGPDSRPVRIFPAYWRQPVYPLLVAASFAVAGAPEPNAVLVLQALGMLALALGAYVLGRRFLDPPWAAAAAFWTLLSPPVLGIGGPLIATTWFAAWVAWFLAVLFRVRGRWAWFAVGLLLGVGAMLRLETWVLLPGFLVGLWLSARRGRLPALGLAAAGEVAGKVLCNERDRALCRTILQRLAQEGQTGFTLAEEPLGADAPAGGVVIRTERFDLDLSLEAALAELRERVMPDLIALAFSGVEERGDAGG